LAERPLKHFLIDRSAQNNSEHNMIDQKLSANESVRICSFNVRHGDCTLVEYMRDDTIQFRMLIDAGEQLPQALVC
jgi:hypothetical protein